MGGNNREKSTIQEKDRVILEPELLQHGNSQKIKDYTGEIAEKTKRLSRNPYIGKKEGELHIEKIILMRIFNEGNMTADEYNYKIELINFAINNPKSL